MKTVFNWHWRRDLKLQIKLKKETKSFSSRRKVIWKYLTLKARLQMPLQPCNACIFHFFNRNIPLQNDSLHFTFVGKKQPLCGPAGSKNTFIVWMPKRHFATGVILCVPGIVVFINCHKPQAELKCASAIDPDSYSRALDFWVFNCFVKAKEATKNRGSIFMSMKVRISGTHGRSSMKISGIYSTRPIDCGSSINDVTYIFKFLFAQRLNISCLKSFMNDP